MAPDENIREAGITSFYMKKIKIYVTVNTNFRALNAQGQCIKEQVALLPSCPLTCRAGLRLMLASCTAAVSVLQSLAMLLVLGLGTKAGANRRHQ